MPESGPTPGSGSADAVGIYGVLRHPDRAVPRVAACGNPYFRCAAVMLDQAAIAGNARGKARSLLGNPDLIFQICQLIVHGGAPNIADHTGPNAPRVSDGAGCITDPHR